MLNLPTLPIEEPVLVFTIALAVFLVAPLVIERLGQPGIVGIVVVGAVVGPNFLGLVELTDAIELLGTVGLVYLLFMVAVDLDLQGFANAPEDAALFGLTSFGLPFLVGTALGIYVLGFDVLAAALLAAVFSSHTLLAYPVVNRLGVTKNRAVTAVFGGILFTDTLALVVLALALGAIEGGLSVWLLAEVALSLAILFGAVWLLVPPIARWFFRNLREESYFEFLFVMVAFFAAASLAELLDIAAILGAFVAGLALNRLVSRGGTLMNRIEFVGNALFVPFFLLYVGMLVDVGVILDGVLTLQIAAFIVVVMFAMKFGAAWLVSRVQGYDPTERNVIFGLSVGQAAAALAITLVGFDMGVFDPVGEHVLNAVVLMLLVTTIVSPWVTRRAAEQLAVSGEVGPAEDAALDPRVLLPLSHAAELQRRLAELAFLLKGENGQNPVHALTVIRPGSDTESRVAQAREALDNVVEVGDAAEVEIDVETRVNHSVVGGISQAAVEVQTDLILMGWDATRSLEHHVFGSIIDRVLGATRLPVLVSRLGHPINTTKELYLVLPRGIDHHGGFFEGLHIVKRLADRLGIEITVLTVEGNPTQHERLFELVEPETNATFEAVDDWSRLIPTLEERTTDDDLVVVLSPREREIGWRPELADLPAQLAELPPESFVVLHPRKGAPEYEGRFLKIG